MEFSFDSSELDKNLLSFPDKLNAALLIYGGTVAKKLESEAKRNRPWTDRTNRARLGLTGSSEKAEDGVRVVLAHTVDYGIWLELAHEKRYAIVEPTVRMSAPPAVEGLKNLVDKIKF